VARCPRVREGFESWAKRDPGAIQKRSCVGFPILPGFLTVLVTFLVIAVAAVAVVAGRP